PPHIEGPRTFRLSGTSEATAVTAGAAALLASQDHQASPDQIKALLVRNATPLAGVSRDGQGSGEVNVARALRAAVPSDAAQNVAPSSAFLRLLATVAP